MCGLSIRVDAIEGVDWSIVTSSSHVVIRTDLNLAFPVLGKRNCCDELQMFVSRKNHEFQDEIPQFSVGIRPESRENELL